MLFADPVSTLAQFTQSAAIWNRRRQNADSSIGATEYFEQKDDNTIVNANLISLQKKTSIVSFIKYDWQRVF